MEVHLEGDYHPLVMQYVNNLTWPFGAYEIKKRNIKAGLETNIVESWKAEDDKEFALMFEDDIEVSKDYFDYCLYGLANYVFTGPRGVRGKDYYSNHIFGFSLTTPRYDETSIPRKEWTPIDVIGDEEHFFLFQLACSWGALYVPWSWRAYLRYYAWRKSFDLPKKIDVLPHSYVNIWERSWKRYLQELMFIRGGAMLYPSFPMQASFSTHHRELGEHTQGASKVPLVDALGTNNRPIFTVPLLNDTAMVQAAFRSMRSIDKLPVVDFYHNRTTDIYALKELGMGTADMLREFGLDLSAFNQNPSCFLDHGKPLWIRDKKGDKYLSYVPHGTILEQLQQLRKAIAMSHILNRVLLVPDFQFGGESVKVGQVLDEMALYSSNHGFVKIKPSGHDKLTPNRLIAFRPFDSQGQRPDTVSIPKHMDARQIDLPLGPGTDMDIQRWFHGCNDEVLMFTDLSMAFSQYVNLTENSLFDEFIDDTVKLAPSLHEKLVSFKDNFTPGSFACVEYYQPDPIHCRKPKYEFKYWRSMHFRNCNATLDRILRYGVGWIEMLYDRQHDYSALYLIDHSMSEYPLITYHSGNNDLYSLVKRKDLVDFFKNMNGDLLLDLLEYELCRKSPFYLGNAYSPFTQSVINWRARQRSPTAILGMGMMVPFRNATLPGND